MTTIVGVAHEGQVWIGADRAATVSGYMNQMLAFPKLMQWELPSTGDKLIMGMSGDLRVINVVSIWTPPDIEKEGETIDQYMTRKFMPAFRTMAEVNELLCVNEENGKQFYGGGAVMVGIADRLFTICDNLALEEMAGGLSTCGSGSYYAMGALMALTEHPPEQRVTRALEIAVSLDLYTRPPFDIYHT